MPIYVFVYAQNTSAKIDTGNNGSFKKRELDVRKNKGNRFFF